MSCRPKNPPSSPPRQAAQTNMEPRRGGRGRAAMAARGAAQTRCRSGSPNLKRRRDESTGPAAGPGELHVCLDQALRAAKGNLEALLQTGGAEKMKSEELEELSSCLVAVLQLVEKARESVKKREQAALLKEMEERAAKLAAATAELERREKENAELEQVVCTQRIVIQSQRAAQTFRGEQIENLTCDLRRLEEQNADLQKKASDQLCELTCRGQEVEELRLELCGRGQEIMDLRGKLEGEKCRICFARACTVILPCSHFQFCNLCLQQHRERAITCPTCRVTISGTMELYAS